jgi:tyrosyl-tRNA synthetase
MAALDHARGDAASPASLLDDLSTRGMIHDATDLDELRARLAQGTTGIYIGFDPTADSLHVGHLVGQLLLRRFQVAGHRPFALAGGATGMIGDPGGRSAERNLLDADTLGHNLERIERQLTTLLDFEPGPCQATLVNNAEWTTDITMLEFLRDVGKYVTVNQMIAKDSVRSRIQSEHGISYTEFSYMLLQANDFRHLHDAHGVEIQAGASDQWGNIVAGVDLIRRRSGATVHGLTHPLVTKSDGSKFGKSVDGAVWLDRDKTSPYKFWQFWRQSDDAMVGTYLMMLSMRPVEEILATLDAHEADPGRAGAQRALADELTTMVHGAPSASAAREAADLLFAGDPTTASLDAVQTLFEEIPSSTLAPGTLEGTVATLVAVGLATSNGDARRNLAQRAYHANGHPIDEETDLARVPLLHDRYLLLRKGRKVHHLVEIFS